MSANTFYKEQYAYYINEGFDASDAEYNAQVDTDALYC
jgi:hypothetical protein